MTRALAGASLATLLALALPARGDDTAAPAEGAETAPALPAGASAEASAAPVTAVAPLAAAKVPATTPVITKLPPEPDAPPPPVDEQPSAPAETLVPAPPAPEPGPGTPPNAPVDTPPAAPVGVPPEAVPPEPVPPEPVPPEPAHPEPAHPESVPPDAVPPEEAPPEEALPEEPPPPPVFVPVRINVARPSRFELSLTADGGYDGNVRLLADVEPVAAGVPVADGFGGFGLGVWREPSESGLVAWVDGTFRKFWSAENGALGSGAGRVGWRFRLGPWRLEPAVEATAFGWSVFPTDAHVSAALAPEIGLQRGRLAVAFQPSVRGRRFDSGTDLEAFGRATATLWLGPVSLTAAFVGGGVQSATEGLSRSLWRGEAGLSWQVAGPVALGLRAGLASKLLPDYPADDSAGAGREDRIIDGRAYVRWTPAATLSFVLAGDALDSQSNHAIGTYRRWAGTLTAEWRWEPSPWKRARLTGPREVTFRLDAPEAHDVQLAASFLGWESVPLKRGAKGTWSVTLPVEPGDHHYGFVIDGAYALPKDLPIADDGLGSEDALLVVGGG